MPPIILAWPHFFFSHSVTCSGIGTWLIFLWAGAIGYAQIYVGVHYPSDIAGGMALGIIYGTFTGLVFNKYFGLHFPVKSLS
jgi:membrane-associated phospholipid phosphatase